MIHSGPFRLVVLFVVAAWSTAALAQRTSLHEHHVFHRIPAPAQSTKSISPANGTNAHANPKPAKAKLKPST
jgi:hypothetical protein